MKKSTYTKGMFVVLHGDRFPVATRMQRTVARHTMREIGADVATVYASHRDGSRVYVAPVAFNGNANFSAHGEG